MILALTTTHQPATDLGYLLHKNPRRLHEIDINYGKAFVFYPEATEERCTAVLMLDIDPVGLVRGSGTMDQYVNDRPYAANSFLSVSMGKIYGTAISGRCKDKPELAETEIPLEARLPVVRVRGNLTILNELLEPIGYQVEYQKTEGSDLITYVDLTIRATTTIKKLLTHLFVLIPVLDDRKHYYIGDTEVDKLIAKGEGWLEQHPLKEQIVRRYLKRSHSLVREALARLEEVEEVAPVEEETETEQDKPEDSEQIIEKPMSLNRARMETMVETIQELGARRVVDLGCGEGRLIEHLMKVKEIERVVGMDVSISSLEYAVRRLKFDRLSPRQRARVDVIHGSLVYRDSRLEGFDVATLVEVIEHLDAPRLRALEKVVFEYAKPPSVLVSTPNREYNVLFEGLGDRLRHTDHRFEWTREEFRAWATKVSEAHGYTFEMKDIGKLDETHGAPTQMAIFRRTA